MFGINPSLAGRSTGQDQPTVLGSQDEEFAEAGASVCQPAAQNRLIRYGSLKSADDRHPGLSALLAASYLARDPSAAELPQDELLEKVRHTALRVETCSKGSAFQPVLRAVLERADEPPLEQLVELMSLLFEHADQVLSAEQRRELVEEVASLVIARSVGVYLTEGERRYELAWERVEFEETSFLAQRERYEDRLNLLERQRQQASLPAQVQAIDIEIDSLENRVTSLGRRLDMLQVAAAKAVRDLDRFKQKRAALVPYSNACVVREALRTGQDLGVLQLDVLLPEIRDMTWDLQGDPAASAGSELNPRASAYFLRRALESLLQAHTRSARPQEGLPVWDGVTLAALRILGGELGMSLPAEVLLGDEKRVLTDKEAGLRWRFHPKTGRIDLAMQLLQRRTGSSILQLGSAPPASRRNAAVSRMRCVRFEGSVEMHHRNGVAQPRPRLSAPPKQPAEI